MGHVGQKLGHWSNLKEKPCVRFRGHIIISENHETWSECLS